MALKLPQPPFMVRSPTSWWKSSQYTMPTGMSRVDISVNGVHVTSLGVTAVGARAFGATALGAATLRIPSPRFAAALAG